MKLSRLVVLGFVYSFLHFSLLAQAGDLDPSFANNGVASSSMNVTSGASPFRTALAVQPDGKIVMAGVTLLSGSDVFEIQRRNADGSLDLNFGSSGFTRFSSGFFEGVAGMALQPDGKIIITGERFSSSTDFIVIRLNTDGTLDSTFDGNGVAVANVVGNSEEHGGNVTLQPDGKIIVVGWTDLGVTP